MLKNVTSDGVEERFENLTFHGGTGFTLEMRLFSRAGLFEELKAAGFTDITVHSEPVPEYGIEWTEPWSLPLTARAPDDSSDAAASAPERSLHPRPKLELRSPPEARDAEMPEAQRPVYADGVPDLSVMREDWDARAHENAMHYVATGKSDWTSEDFLDSGRADIGRFVVPILPVICAGRDAKTMRVLDIGCGLGRLTNALGEVFGEAHGIDVSDEMIRQGKEFLAGIENVYLYKSSGTDLSLFPDDHFDFAFSYIVFQHIPYREVIVRYLEETHRVLRPGSVFKFQVQGAPIEDPTTWVGVSFTADEMAEVAKRSGFRVLEMNGEGTQYQWLTWISANP